MLIPEGRNYLFYTAARETLKDLTNWVMSSLNEFPFIICPSGKINFFHVNTADNSLKTNLYTIKLSD